MLIMEKRRLERGAYDAIQGIFHRHADHVLRESAAKADQAHGGGGVSIPSISNASTPPSRSISGSRATFSFLRPNFAKTVADAVRKRGGKPFLTDCNTLYVGGRKNALDHLDAAYENGFSPFSTGCHVLIADGLKGTDEVLVKIPGTYVRQAKIGRAVADADVILSLSHFKGHECTGFGGALKNLGMGCGSRAGKMEMHSSSKPSVEESACVGCGACARNCAHDAILLEAEKAFIDHGLCVGCGPLHRRVPSGRGAGRGGTRPFDVLSRKIAEYTLAVLRDKPSFHVSLVVDVSPYCDCHSENDAPLIPNIGMFASFDPVALDQACVDAVNRQSLLPGQRADGQDRREHGSRGPLHPPASRHGLAHLP